ncbi:MAG: hypothetical protein AAGA63_08610 [Pseudomonadota bacterium]
MSNSIFFAWQSDRDRDVCKHFVRECLEDAVKKLKAEVSVENADRPETKVLQDTQGIPGSPDISKVILQRIEECAVFVPDLTFIADRPVGYGRISNPNVLIEYGFALKAVQNERIVAVMNTAFGAPEEDGRHLLPFDLNHLRRPIEYNLDPGDSAARKAEAKENLSNALRVKIRDVLKAYPVGQGATPNLHVQQSAGYNASTFLKIDQPLFSVQNPVATGFVDIKLRHGSYMYLRVMPKFQSEELNPFDLEAAISPDLRDLALRPFGRFLGIR